MKRKPMRTRTQPVRLTEDERERAERLVKLYGGTLSDVLRAGIAALEREHVAETSHAGHVCGFPGPRGSYCAECVAIERTPR